MRRLRLLVILLCVGILAGCMGPQKKGASTFGKDLKFLKKHTDVIVLSDERGDGRVAVIPQMQGRVMTSTAGGTDGLSFGWINRELVASGEFVEHINVFGGEDRFWLGPEGGQFSIFFKNGVPFDLEHWFTPAPIDTEPFELVFKSKSIAVLKKDIRLENYSRTVFNLRVDRRVRILGRNDAVELLGVTPAPAIKMVAFDSTNKVTNTGEKTWEKETGLLSIWILGMLNPSPATTVVVPFETGPEDKLGPIVNDAYFGKVPADRLVVKDGVLFFSGDGQYRSKIGLSPLRAKPVLGSYDAVNQVLTIVQYNKPRGTIDYVNSMWELQDEPYKGDVVNSYNDGPPEPGAEPLGPFYELESSSPAAALEPDETITHIHRTFHLQGTEADLNTIAEAALGVTIDEIKSAF
ncbi:MAG: DUF6786 family protein [Planctomycetota bacterium]